MTREKAIGAALVLLGVTVAIAVLGSSSLLGRWRDPEFVDMASTETVDPVMASASDSAADAINGTPKSLAATATVEATPTAAAEQQDATMTARATSLNGFRSAAAAPDAVPNGAPGSVPSAPGQSESPGRTATRVTVIGGRAYHEVWGTPLPDVPIRLSPLRRTTKTNASGDYLFGEIPEGTLVVVAVDSSDWLSHGSAVYALLTPSDRTPSFGLYHAGEAVGRDWRNAAGWRGAGRTELQSAVVKVAAGSSIFSGISPEQAVAVLARGKNGTPEHRAKAELLATWLDLATGRLGFDTAVSMSQVGGADAKLAGSANVLSLVRSAEAAMAANSGVDWNVLRRALSARALRS